MPLINKTMANIARCKIIIKLDIRKAFNRIRIAILEDEDLSTFYTPLGNYKSQVLRFGLYNRLASFQRFINETLFEYLNVFYIAYIDDILIYIKDEKEHLNYMRLVLLRLRAAGLQVDINKSEFNVTKTKFLGLIISTKGIEIDPAKIEVIKE